MTFYGTINALGATALLVMLGRIVFGEDLKGMPFEFSAGFSFGASLLALSFAAIVGAGGTYFFGGIGVLRGRRWGAEKGATASVMILMILAVNLCLGALATIAMDGLDAGLSELGPMAARVAGLAVIPLMFLKWCNTTGQELPD